MGFDTSAVEVLDRDPNTPGVQPLAVDSDLAASARILQNRIDPLDSTQCFGNSAYNALRGTKR